MRVKNHVSHDHISCVYIITRLYCMCLYELETSLKERLKDTLERYTLDLERKMSGVSFEHSSFH